MPLLPHKFLQEFLQFYEIKWKGQEKRKREKWKMLSGAQKKKNSCSRFPSVFLILIFFFISYFFFVFCLYSLVAPSDKKEEIRI